MQQRRDRGLHGGVGNVPTYSAAYTVASVRSSGCAAGSLSGADPQTEPKPIRVFLQDGSKDTWNPLFGSWFKGNLDMEAALSFAGYEVGHAWGEGGHDGVQGTAIFPT